MCTKAVRQQLKKITREIHTLLTELQLIPPGAKMSEKIQSGLPVDATSPTTLFQKVLQVSTVLL